MATVYIGLGSNLGNRQASLEGAIRLFPPEIRVEKVSHMCESDPTYRPGEPRYLNMACGAQTELSPQELFRKLRAVEISLGRLQREQKGPRPIDLDILFYDDLVLETPELTIPHPKLSRRAFVLDPLAAIAPRFVHPQLRRTIAELREALGNYSHKLQRVDETSA